MNRLFLAGAVLVFAVINTGIVQKEHLKSSGNTVLLQLAPVDPRSLMQGDFMRLNYALPMEIPPQKYEDMSRAGHLVVELDKNNVARYKRVFHGGNLKRNEILLRYRLRGARQFRSFWMQSPLRIAPESFLFQEGDAEIYARAVYAELAVDGRGSVLLIGLRDREFRKLEPEK